MELMLGELLDTFNPIYATSVLFGFAFLAGNKFVVLCETNSSESKVWYSPAQSRGQECCPTAVHGLVNNYGLQKLSLSL